MSEVAIRTFKDIQDAIIDRAKIEDNDDNRRQIKEKINTTYQETVYEEFYTWSGEEFPLFLPKKYTTGTITVTQYSDIITGASTVWTENSHRYMKMMIAGSNTPYKVLRVASTTSITLDKQWVGDTAAGVSYTIYQDDFGLMPDLQDLRQFNLHGVIRSQQPSPIGPTEFDQIRSQRPFAGGSPRRHTIWGNSHYKSKTWATFNINTDFWEDSFNTAPRNKTLKVWPGIRTADMYATVRYTKIAPPMLADADEPIIPSENRPILLYGTLVDHFLQNRDVAIKREWEKKYDYYKKKMAADIETTDDELILTVDNLRNRWTANRFTTDEDSNENQ